jgi:hypothetical protein
VFIEEVWFWGVGVVSPGWSSVRLVVRNVNFEGRRRCLGDVVGHSGWTCRAGSRVVGGEA